VIKAYPDKLRADPEVRASALALCATRPAWAMELLAAIDRKKQVNEKFVAHTIDKNDVPEPIVKQLLLLADPEVAKLTMHLWPEVRVATPAEKNATISRITRLLESGGGNQDNGRKIFMATCGSCHRLFGEGGNIGPDLTGYDRGNLRDLLNNIVDPNAYIREGYVSYQVTTSDGRTISGTLKSRTASAISLQPFSGDPITLGLNQVKEIKEQKTSIMPERLLEKMPDQQIKDLLTYLTRQDKKQL